MRVVSGHAPRANYSPTRPLFSSNRLPYKLRAHESWHRRRCFSSRKVASSKTSLIHTPYTRYRIVFAMQMLRFCRAMHSASILHMDIKPDNWLLIHRSGSEGAEVRGIGHTLSLIDFGRAIDLAIFPRNGSSTAFTGQCCTSSFMCPAMTEASFVDVSPQLHLLISHGLRDVPNALAAEVRPLPFARRTQGRAWKHDADLFALGSCVYFMLHGVYLEVFCEQNASPILSASERRWRPARSCKR